MARSSLSQCVDFLAEKMVVSNKQQVLILNCPYTVKVIFKSVCTITFEIKLSSEGNLTPLPFLGQITNCSYFAWNMEQLEQNLSKFSKQNISKFKKNVQHTITSASKGKFFLNYFSLASWPWAVTDKSETFALVCGV